MAKIDNPLFKKTATGDFGVMHLPVGSIQPSPHQARKTFAEDSIAELAESIKTVGLLQPIKVVKENETFYLVYGERRLRALRHAGITEMIWDSRTGLASLPGPSDPDLAVQSLTENILRENLSAIEEAEAYQHVRAIKGFKKQQELADYMGIDKRRISEKLQLLELSDSIKQELISRAGQVTASHARELMKLDSEELQFEVIKRISDQALSVKETSKLVNDLRRRAPKMQDAEERLEMRRRVEQRKFIRRFEQLCRQLLNAAEAVAETDALKSAFRAAFATDDNVIASLERALRAVRAEVDQAATAATGGEEPVVENIEPAAEAETGSAE